MFVLTVSGPFAASRYLDVYLLLGSYGLPVGSSLYEIGICPTFTGNVIGSLPPGSTFPNRTSATASPPSVPGYHASSSAGALAASQSIVSGRPFIITTTYGLPVLAIACTSASCWPGRPSIVRDDASPLSEDGSPTTTTVTAADCAALTAAPNPDVDVQLVSQPCAYVTVAPGTAFLMPWTTG